MLTLERPVVDLELSDEEVTRILDALDESELPIGDSERRSERRYLRGTALLVRLTRPGFTTADFRVRLRNISQHGVAFLSRYDWAPGTRLFVELPIGEQLAPTEKAAVVKRNREVADKVYEIGAEFR
jgi:hypothetical protein